MSGQCYRCSRELTTPASLAAGIGPECAGKLHGWSKTEQEAGADRIRQKALYAENEREMEAQAAMEGLR